MPDIQSNTTIVYITYNSCHLLDAILNRHKNIKTLVLDNASSDGSAEKCEQQYPNIELIKNTINAGYGRAANEAFSQVSTAYALLLNPDVEVDTENLNKLLTLPDNLADDWLFIVPNSGHAPEPLNTTSVDNLTPISEATGCAMLFNLKKFNQLGGFDENIFLYYEEMDLCARALQADLKMYYAEGVAMQHDPGKSTTPTDEVNFFREWHFRWSALYYYRKRQKWFKYYKLVVANLLFAPLKSLFTGKKSRHAAAIKWSATFAFLRGTPAFDQYGKALHSDTATNLLSTPNE